MSDRLALLRAARNTLAASIAQQQAALADLDKQIKELASVPEQMPDARFTAAEVARMFKISLRTLYTRINEGKFPAPAYDSGRKRVWTRSQIEALS